MSDSPGERNHLEFTNFLAIRFSKSIYSSSYEVVFANLYVQLIELNVEELRVSETW